jgi:hypothetical protein
MKTDLTNHLADVERLEASLGIAELARFTAS